MDRPPTLAEQLLGGMIVHNSTILSALSMLRAHMFPSKADRLVFEAIIQISQAGLPVNLVNVGRQLGVAGVLAQGGYHRLAYLWKSACRELDVCQLATTLR